MNGCSVEVQADEGTVLVYARSSSDPYPGATELDPQEARALASALQVAARDALRHGRL